MAFKTLVRLLGILLVIALIALIVKCAGDRQGVATVESSPEKRKVFDDFPINDVGQIKLFNKEESVTIRKGKDSWEVTERENYPADAKQVVDLVRKIWDLNIAQPIALQRNQFGRVKLLDPKGAETASDEAATVLELAKADGTSLGSIWLGKVHEASEGRTNPYSGGMMMNDVGRYVKRGNNDAVFIVGETFRDADPKPSDWLDQEFFKVSKIKSISRKTKNAADDWSLTRENISGDFTLVGAKEGEELDSSKVTSMKTAFDNNPRFEDVYTGEEAKEPDHSIFTVETFDGFTYVVAAGEKNDLNELPLTVKVTGKFAEKREEGEEESDEEKKRKDADFARELAEKKEKLAKEERLNGRVFKVRSFVVDSITKTRSELLKEKEEKDAAGEKPAAAPPGKGRAKGEKGKAGKAPAPKKEQPKAGKAEKGKAGKAPPPKKEQPKAGKAEKGKAGKAPPPKKEQPKAGKAEKGKAGKAPPPKKEQPKAGKTEKGNAK